MIHSSSSTGERRRLGRAQQVEGARRRSPRDSTGDYSWKALEEAHRRSRDSTRRATNAASRDDRSEEVGKTLAALVTAIVALPASRRNHLLRAPALSRQIT